MKKYFSVLFAFLILVCLSACSEETVTDGDILRFIQKYKAAQYTIQYEEGVPSGEDIAKKVKPFLSKAEFKTQMDNRVFDIAPMIARKINKNMEVRHIHIEKVRENEAGNFDYQYTLELELSDGNSSDIVERKGQITIETADGLLITRDHEERTTKIDGIIF